MGTQAKQDDESNPFDQDMVVMEAPVGMGDQLAVGGFSLKFDSKRRCRVPSTHVPALIAHGLSRVPVTA